ncbi:hypothetical protein [Caldovatus sediminis]|nr:hypothetical protein [Caldovatus sediminis]
MTTIEDLEQEVERLIEAAGCTPDNGHRYWALRDAALGGAHG